MIEITQTENVRQIYDSRRKLITTAATIFTIIYLSIFLTYAYVNNPFGLPPNELGDFLAGSFAPMAFFWFVIAYWQQSLELRLNTDTLTYQVKEMKNSVKQLKEQASSAEKNVRVQAQNSMVELCNFYTNELSSIAFVIYRRMASVDIKRGNILWERYSNGDKDLFFRIFFEGRSFDFDQTTEWIGKGLEDSIALGMTQRFSGIYQAFLVQLQGLASEVGGGDLVVDAYKTGYLGDLHKIFSQKLYGRDVVA